MARKMRPGLVKHAVTWHTDKHINGQRVCQCTGAVQFEEAERLLARLKKHNRRRAMLFSVAHVRTGKCRR